MKKIVIGLIAALAVTSSFAQFEKGRILAGGSVGFSTHTYKIESNNTTTTTAKSTSLSFNPKAGYFIIDKLALGAGINLLTTTNKDERSSDKEITTSTSFDPFVRYYLDPGIFFQGSFGVGYNKFKETNGNTTTTTKDNVSNWSLSAGYAIFLNDHVAIEPSIGYQSYITKNNPDLKFIDSSLFINVGFQIYLGAKK